jgi:hypothetical protein
MGATTVLFPVLLALVLDRGRLPAAVVIADAASAPGRLGAPRGSAPESPSVFGIVVVVGVFNYKEETTRLVGKEEMDSNQHSIVLDSLLFPRSNLCECTHHTPPDGKVRTHSVVKVDKGSGYMCSRYAPATNL